MILFVSLLALAQSDEASREADMFGEAPAETATVAPTSTAPPGDPFLEETTSDRDVSTKLAEADDVLDIGAFVYLRAQYDAREDSEPGELPLTSANLLDVYLDGRPNDRIRAFVQGRLNFRMTATSTAGSFFGPAPERVEPLLDQLWLKFDVDRTVFVTVGRQRIKWGSGRFWNPTDFLQAIRDPLDIFDARIGVDLVKLHLPIESLGWNFYAVGTFAGADTPEELGGALRAEILIAEAELAVSTAVRKDSPLRLGVDLSLPIGPFDVHSEVGVQHGVKTPFYTGEIELALPPVPETFDRSDDWIVQAASGFEIAVRYGDQDSVYLGAEYFYNGAGYTSADVYPALLLGGAFTPFYVGRHYAAVFAALPSPGDWNNTTFSLSGLANLSDRSGVLRLDYQVGAVLSYLRFNAFGQVSLGEVGELRFGIDSAALERRYNLPAGVLRAFELPPSLFSVGVGLSLEI
jgi:hypothetical protein